MTAVEGRPALPKLSRGDALIMRCSDGRRDGWRRSDVRVVAVGPKYVHVIGASHYPGYDSKRDAWFVRRFLLSDQREGPTGTRVGYAASIATAEQDAYDTRQMDAVTYLRDQGITVALRSPWYGRETALAEALKRAVDA